MTPKPIEQARNPDLRAAMPALRRAALQARRIAAQTGTALVVEVGHRIVRRTGKDLAVADQAPSQPTP